MAGLPLVSRLAAAVVAVGLAFGAFVLEAGSASADPGSQTAGDGVAFNYSGVNQHNVQVIAGDSYTKENSTQTAINEANVDQTAVAIGGGSGGAVAGNISFVSQLNVQVIAGVGCSADQYAANYADVNQTAVAVGSGASALNVSFVRQHNIQVHTCNGTGGHATQSATNWGAVGQTSVAAGTNTSASNWSEVSQTNRQYSRGR